MDWDKESASVYIHFKDTDPSGFIRDILGDDYAPADEDSMEAVFTRTELETMQAALDYMAQAMSAAGFPTGLVDDLADKLQDILEG